MRIISAIAALLWATPSVAQISNPPDVTAQVQAAMPPVCNLAPPQDTITGTPGVAAPCTHRADAASQTVIQAKNTVTAADATYAITWDAPFAAPPIYADARVYGTAQPFVCTVTATESGATGKCFQLVSTTLPTLAGSLLGLVLSPIANAAGGVSVRVVARQ